MISPPNYQRYLLTDDGLLYDKDRDQYLKPHINNCGYEVLSLKTDENNWRTEHIGRLIALTYLPNPQGLAQVDHIDRNRLHNHIKNLRWTSVSQNNHNRKMRCDNKLGVKNIGEERGDFIYRKMIHGSVYQKRGKTLPHACFEQYIHDRLVMRGNKTPLEI